MLRRSGDQQPKRGSFKYGRLDAGRHRLRAQSSGLGCPDRAAAGVRRIAGLHLAGDPGLGCAGGDRRADRRQRHQLLAGLARRRASARRWATGCRIGSAIATRSTSRRSGRCRAIRRSCRAAKPSCRNGACRAFSSAGFSGRCGPRCRWPPAFSRCRTGSFQIANLLSALVWSAVLLLFGDVIAQIAGWLWGRSESRSQSPRPAVRQLGSRRKRRP